MTITFQVAGPERPCKNCKKTLQVINKVAKSYENSHEVKVEHINLVSPETLSKYGMLKGPAVILNDTIICEGKIPGEKFIHSAISKIVTNVN